MKIKTLKKFKTKLLKFKLLKTKIYKYNNELNYSHLKDTETRLKQICHILYKFHITNKKILFLGNPLNLNNQIKHFLQAKQHKFLPESFWVNGILTNPKTSFKHLKQQYALTRSKSSKLLLSLQSQIDLVVLLNEQNNMKNLNESSAKRIPVISLNSVYNLANLNLTTYEIPGDSNFIKKPTRENVFFLLFNSLLKKAEILRKQRIQWIMKQEKLRQQKKKAKQNRKHKNNVYKKKK